MIHAVCSNFTKRLQHLYIILPRMAVRGTLSRVMSVCFPLQGLILKCPQVAAIRSVTVRSFYSMTVASSLHGFRSKSICRYRTSLLHGRSLWPVTMLGLRCQSASAAPDVFPKRVTRRTKKKDPVLVHPSEVDRLSLKVH